MEKSKQPRARADCLNVVTERVQDCRCLWCISCKVNDSNILSKSARIYREEALYIPTVSAKSPSFLLHCANRGISVSNC